MVRHVCPNCGATVTGDEQFCPTCGTYLAHDDEPGHEEDYERFDLGSVPPPPTQREPVICPSCGAANAPTNRHCEECGARLSQGPLPAAPRPAVQATAGVRAVIAIGGLLLGVIIIALLFQLFSGDGEEAPGTTVVAGDTTSTTTQIAELDILDPLDADCSIEGLGSFICDNLISGTDALYQVNWENVQDSGETLTITIEFRSAVAIARIDWVNITNDDTRWRRNYRARSLTISSDDTLSDAQIDLQNIPGKQQIDFASLSTHQVTITVNSAWPAEIVDGQIFTELAIDEIEVIGRPATTGTTPGTTPEDTDDTDDTGDTSGTTEAPDTTETEG